LALVSLDAVTGPVCRLTFDWTVSVGSRSLTARTSGIYASAKQRSR